MAGGLQSGYTANLTDAQYKSSPDKKVKSKFETTSAPVQCPCPGTGGADAKLNKEDIR